MSKVSMPRPRYVAVRLEGPTPLPRRAVADLVRDAARRQGWERGMEPQLTRYEWPHAIVRVDHTLVAQARALLAALGRHGLPATTLSTSGTLKALTGRLGILQERGERS
jgi:RNase P/RNase MRP subunit POP5